MEKNIQKILLSLLPAIVLTCVLISSAYAISPQEEGRINALINALANQQDIVFIRNGSEHTAVEAADHLRLKFSKTRNRINTAEQFIDKVASGSSISGKAYSVRVAGQDGETANIFLHKLLKQVDK